MTDLRLVSDCWPTVSAGVVEFPLARWPWKSMTLKQADAHLARALEIARSEVPHRQIKLARETLERLANDCPHAEVRRDASIALDM